MCGIFGFNRKSNDQQPDKLLHAMAQAQLHRGPDGEGQFIDDNVALGMRRLSIIDLETGDQPFFSDDASVVVFCNGEIYNYIELRNELKNEGKVFKTHSDIEVIPHLYQKHGLRFIDKLNGMFAICIYDKKTNSLHLIRDRLGIKPFYYSFEKDQLIFASELKSILAVKNFSVSLDYKAISAYLDLLFVPAPLTGFNEIRKLPSGTILSFEGLKRISLSQYWGPSNYDLISDEKGILDALDFLLDDSTNLQMRSDVPVGAYLSGGIDSSSIVAFAAKKTEKPLDTFHLSWGNVRGKINEERYARKVSEKYKTNFNVTSFGDMDVPRVLAKLIWHIEEPLADAAFVPTYVLAKAASEKVKVILSGAGGDELFGGYHNHKKFSIIKSLAKKILYNCSPATSCYDRWKIPHAIKWEEIFGWYIPDSMKNDFDTIYTKFKGVDLVNAQMLSDTFNYLQDDILCLTDKTTMAASLECRVPLLDHRLVEFSWKIPSSFKVKNNERKYILKKLMENHLPVDVIYRPKEGFGIPINTWLEKHESTFRRVLENGFLVRHDLTAKDPLKNTHGFLFWKILILDIWAQIFIENKPHGQIFENSN